MAVLLLIGGLSYKRKLIDEAMNKKLSNLLLNLVIPLLLIISFQRDWEEHLAKGLAVSFLLAFISHGAAILLSQVLLPGKKNRDVSLERFAVIYSNCGFIGIPMVNGLFGLDGVFYLTAYIAVFNLFMWTHGVFMMVGKQDLKTTLKTLASPTVISIFVGVILFLLQIHIPDILYQSFNYVASMNTPLAMIIAGVTIAQTDLRKIFGKLRIYYISFLKLLVLPIILLLLYHRFPIDSVVLSTAILAVACPTGAAVTLFALRYDKNTLYSSEIFAVTTLFSIGTMPLVMAIVQILV